MSRSNHLNKYDIISFLLLKLAEICRFQIL